MDGRVSRSVRAQCLDCLTRLSGHRSRQHRACGAAALASRIGLSVHDAGYRARACHRRLRRWRARAARQRPTLRPISWAPLVLAVGALRYDVKVQLCAIALLALGLIEIAVALGDSMVVDPGVTPTWPQLFSMPVNVMRFTLLLLAGAATAFGIIRSRRLLSAAVKDAVGGASLSRFLPAEIAPRVAGDIGLRRGRRQRAVVFVDIRDSTGMAEGMDPERLSQFFTAFRTRILGCVRKHRGFVGKFIGDGALILFGVPDEGGDDVARALAFAHDLVRIV